LTYRESIKVDDENVAVKNMVEQNLDKMATETLLQNVKVLAVDQMAERPEDNKVKVAKTVTVAVSMQDAERLFLASEMGNLSLALRGVGDEDVTKPSWPVTSDMRLTTISDEIRVEAERLKKDTSVNPNIVRIYSGENVTSQPAR
jgi:pilus assembly protein CpaB